MNRSEAFLAIIFFLTVSIAGGAYASPDCEHWAAEHLNSAAISHAFHHKHRLSKKRVAEILAWNKAHPNWHPKTRRETLHMLDFACGGDEVATITPDVTAFVPDLAAPVFSPDSVDVPDDVPGTVAPASDSSAENDSTTEDASTIPSGYPYFPPPYFVGTGGYPPFTPPVCPPPVSSTPPSSPIPEPPTLALLLAGVLGLFLYPRRKEPTHGRSTR